MKKQKRTITAIYYLTLRPELIIFLHHNNNNPILVWRKENDQIHEEQARLGRFQWNHRRKRK